MATDLRYCWSVEFAADQHRPDDAGHLVGESKGGELFGFARQQGEQPRRGAAGFGLLDDRGSAEHQQPAQAFIPLPADPAGPVTAGGRMLARRDAFPTEGAGKGAGAPASSCLK